MKRYWAVAVVRMTWLAGFLVATCSIQAAEGDVFRMETDLFVAGRTEPIAEYLTLFSERTVYDFRVSKPEEIAVFDWDRNRIILIDPSRQWRSVLTTDDVLQFTAAIKTHVKPENAIFYAATHPQFESLEDAKPESDSKFTLKSGPIEYRIQGAAPRHASSVRRYQEFADWSARLSAMRPGNLPPFIRIEVNQTIAQRGWLPEEVVRVVDPGKFGKKKLEVQARHLVNWILSETDRKRIERVGNQMVSFKEVPFAEFRDAVAAESTDKTAKR